VKYLCQTGFLIAIFVTLTHLLYFLYLSNYQPLRVFLTRCTRNTRGIVGGGCFYTFIRIFLPVPVIMDIFMEGL